MFGNKLPRPGLEHVEPDDGFNELRAAIKAFEETCPPPPPWEQVMARVEEMEREESNTRQLPGGFEGVAWDQSETNDREPHTLFRRIGSVIKGLF